jgi:hypothetical protein
MSKPKPSAKTPAEAAYSGDEHEYSNRLREHPHMPASSHEGVSASPWRQEGDLLPGYSWHQPPPSALGSFNAPYYPPAEATNTRPFSVYQYPPVMGFADSLQASTQLTHYTQAASSLHRYHQSREAMVYEQLMRTVAPAPLHNVVAPGSLRDLYSAPVVPQLPPWQVAPSVATGQFLPRLEAGSSNLLYTPVATTAPDGQYFPQQHGSLYTPGATAPDGQYFPSQHGSLSCPQQQGTEALEAIALVEASMRPSDAEVNPREKRRQLTRASDPFPVRLFRLLSDLESSGEDQDIASFTASGQAFQILKPPEFMKDVAPRYFRQKHYSSFTRQLNCYGFHKVSHGPDKGAFCHPKFQRDKPELCKGITAKVTEDYRSARVAEMRKLHSTNNS